MSDVRNRYENYHAMFAFKNSLCLILVMLLPERLRERWIHSSYGKWPQYYILPSAFLCCLTVSNFIRKLVSESSDNSFAGDVPLRTFKAGRAQW